MTTDTRAARPMTIADLCEAISEERIGYDRSGDNYLVSGLSLNRYLRGEAPYPTSEPPYLAIGPDMLEPGCTA